MIRRPILLSLVALAVTTPLARAVAQDQKSGAKPELVVGREDFQRLRWIAGSWRGESDAGAPIFERYHFADDSSLVVETFADNKFRSVRSTTHFELRDHKVKSRGGPAWVATGLDSISAAFRVVASPNSEVVWQRHDDDEWTRVETWPPTVDHAARVTTYHMKRVKKD